MVEHLTVAQDAAGSNPVTHPNLFFAERANNNLGSFFPDVITFVKDK